MEGDPSKNCRIIGPIGALYQADIYLAEWTGAEGFTKELTLWKVRPELCETPEAVEALNRDLKLAGQVSSSLATHVIDVWHPKEGFSIAVEHLSGLTLSQAMRRSAEKQLLLPIDVVLSAALQISRALEVAHDPQSPSGPIVHGDIRPENVILGSGGTVKLTGYGFASFLKTISPEGEFCVWDGWCYQPPERLLGDELDPRSDIFSLGLVILEAATGLHPYGTNNPDRLRGLLEAGVSPIPAAGIELPKGLDELVRRACSVDPDERFQTAGEMTEALQTQLFANDRISTSGGMVRHFLSELSGEKELDFFDVEEEEPTVTTKSKPSDRSELLSKVREPAEYPPRIKATEGKFVGRTDVLRTVSQALAGSARGSGMAILWLADPGVGRTRLLAEVAARLSSSEQQRAWLHVEARPAERSKRYSGVLRLLAPLVGLGPDCELEQIGERADKLVDFDLDEEAVQLIVDIAHAEQTSEPARAARVLGHAVTSCISSLSEEQTTIIAWDDLQWTDDGSIACLGDLVKQLPVLSVMALLTASTGFRPPWAPGMYYPVPLDPLTSDELEELVLELGPEAEMVAPTLLDALQLHTLNRPETVEETIGLLLAADRLSVDTFYMKLDGEPAEPLPRLEDQLRERMAALDEDTRSILLTSALAGPAMREDVVAAAVELDPADVYAAFEELAKDPKLLRAGPHGFELADDRTRRGLLEAAPSAALNSLREPTARAILECTDEMEGLDEIAATLLIDAGNQDAAAGILFETAELQESLGDLEGALQRYQWGLELLRFVEDVGDDFRSQLHLGLGRSAFQALRFDVAEHALLEATAHAERCGEHHIAAEAEILLLQLLALQGRLQEAMERAKDAIPLAECTGNPVFLAYAYGAIGEAYQQYGQFGPDLRYIEAAVGFANESGDLPCLGRFLVLALTHAASVGEEEQKQLLLSQTRPVVEEAGSPQLRGLLLRAEIMLCTYAKDYDGAVERSLRGIELAQQYGLNDLEVQLLHNAGDGYLRLERNREALFYFSESLRRSRAAHYNRLTELNEMYVGYIEGTHLNQPDGIERIRHALERTGRNERIWNLYQGHQLLGRHLLSQGDDSAEFHLAEALRYAEKTGVQFFVEEANQLLESSNQD